MQNVIFWGYNHKKYFYSRVFWSEEFISATSFKNNHEINIKSKMNALNLHNREGKCGILCMSGSCNGMIIIIISYVFWNDLNNFW